ncbi:hypothetical protein BJ508DRAFT_3506 [Ascobolus immersus RN42]|uniref:Gfd2/YDR514C-like C-terminal domain-containing protein n=1 Tax=Ascobolus immersus RN42 TaxID=1160509 RepID=A0A3N4IPR6_ASCIM|nr:hypothetical protein BJ508DRAFT_3506 [Ascobolus immersus RN42]
MSDYDDGPGRTRGIQGSYATVQNTRKIPYLKTNRINAADRAMLSKFFDKQPFFARSWDIYHFEDTDNTKDFFLLPMAQVEQFLWMIEEETGVVLKKPVQFNFPEEAYTDELSLLGTSTTEFEYDDLVASINPPDYENTKGTIKSMTTKTNKAYKAERKRLTSLVHGLQQVVLARRWLGFADAQDPEQVRLRTLFVCVDVESHEVNHSAILEVGVTRLDTAELWGEDGNGEPPQSFEELMKKVEVRHFRVKENRFLKNGRFVADCADKFCFGKTEWVGLQEAPAVMAQLFRFPDGGSGRVVFVGHDAGTDKQYLKKLGYNPDNINGLEMLDTAKMWKAIKQEANPKGLGGLCKELDITAWHLHNAGNDAAYTFQCLLKMALDYCPDRGQQPETVQPPPTPEVKRIIVKLPDPSCYPPNPPKTARCTVVLFLER